MRSVIQIPRLWVVVSLALLGFWQPLWQPSVLAGESADKSVRVLNADLATVIQLADSHRATRQARVKRKFERRTAESMRPKFILHAFIDKASTRPRLKNFNLRNIDMLDTRLSGDPETEAFHGLLLQKNDLLNKLYLQGKSEIKFATRGQMRNEMLETYDRKNPLKPMHFTPVGHYILNDLANRMKLRPAVDALANQYFPKDEFIGLKPQSKSLTFGEVSTGREVYKKARQLRFKKQYQAAHKQFEIAAENGNLLALIELGMNQMLGIGTEKNIPQAIKTFETAGKAGHPRGYFLLGALFGGGEKKQLVPIDLAKSGRYYQHCIALNGQATVPAKTAVFNLRQCYTNLGRLAFLGKGIPKDFYLSRRLLWNGAAMGEPLGMYYLGFRYLLGQGGKPDQKKALRWLNKAANLGLKSAEKSIAKLEETTGRKLRRKR